jgi:hypothetical protein
MIKLVLLKLNSPDLNLLKSLAEMKGFSRAESSFAEMLDLLAGFVILLVVTDTLNFKD